MFNSQEPEIEKDEDGNKWEVTQIPGPKVKELKELRKKLDQDTQQFIQLIMNIKRMQNQADELFEGIEENKEEHGDLVREILGEENQGKKFNIDVSTGELKVMVDEEE